jgi:hypothetical protein
MGVRPELARIVRITAGRFALDDSVVQVLGVGEQRDRRAPIAATHPWLKESVAEYRQDPAGRSALEPGLLSIRIQ